MNQFRKGRNVLDAKIAKEIDRGTVWSDRKDKLERCIEKKYSESGSRSTQSSKIMPGCQRQVPSYTWQFCQFSSFLDDKIAKEIAENDGGTVWSNRKDKLKRCIAQKKAKALSQTGKKHTLKTRAKMSEAKKGKKLIKYSIDYLRSPSQVACSKCARWND